MIVSIILIKTQKMSSCYLNVNSNIREDSNGKFIFVDSEHSCCQVNFEPISITQICSYFYHTFFSKLTVFEQK